MEIELRDTCAAFVEVSDWNLSLYMHQKCSIKLNSTAELTAESGLHA